jgi:hypothetical protein
VSSHVFGRLSVPSGSTRGIWFNLSLLRHIRHTHRIFIVYLYGYARLGVYLAAVEPHMRTSAVYLGQLRFLARQQAAQCTDCNPVPTHKFISMVIPSGKTQLDVLLDLSKQERRAFARLSPTERKRDALQTLGRLGLLAKRQHSDNRSARR